MFLRHDPWENSNEDIPVAVAIAARVDEELAAVGLVVKVEGSLRLVARSGFSLRETIR